MKRVHFEVFLAIVSVVGGTLFTYHLLSGKPNFWNQQNFWNSVLLICWAVVMMGYFRQGWLVHKAKSSKNISLFLPIVVFFVQCILFVKGIYYHDVALIFGAVMVNSGAIFNAYQIFRFRHKS
jgi:hypothetical protein